MADKGYHSAGTLTNLREYTTLSQLHSRARAPAPVHMD
jgi:hypothetical protein